MSDGDQRTANLAQHRGSAARCVPAGPGPVHTMGVSFGLGVLGLAGAFGLSVFGLAVEGVEAGCCGASARTTNLSIAFATL